MKCAQLVPLQQLVHDLPFVTRVPAKVPPLSFDRDPWARDRVRELLPRRGGLRYLGHYVCKRWPRWLLGTHDCKTCTRGEHAAFAVRDNRWECRFSTLGGGCCGGPTCVVRSHEASTTARTVSATPVAQPEDPTNRSHTSTEKRPVLVAVNLTATAPVVDRAEARPPGRPTPAVASDSGGITAMTRDVTLPLRPGTTDARTVMGSPTLVVNRRGVAP